MKPESHELANVLLRRHSTVCRPLNRRGPDDVDDQDIKDSIISYGDLCEWAGLRRSYAHPSGNFLGLRLTPWRSMEKHVTQAMAIVKRPVAAIGIATLGASSPASTIPSPSNRTN